MKINYYDFGLWRGTEIGWMVDHIFPSLNITDYKVYGFEACKSYADRLKNAYADNPRIEIINKAVVDTPRTVKLYHAQNQVGHSVFPTKKNVSDQYEEVEGIVFSQWLKENVKSYKVAFNILKVNIEGAEWFLFNDIVDSGVNKYIDIYCGQGHDVEKVGELESKVQAYYELLEKNEIHLHRFTEHLPNQNDDLRSIISNKMKEY